MMHKRFNAGMHSTAENRLIFYGFESGKSSGESREVVHNIESEKMQKALEQFAPVLEQARKSLSPEDYEKMKLQMIDGIKKTHQLVDKTQNRNSAPGYKIQGRAYVRQYAERYTGPAQAPKIGPVIQTGPFYTEGAVRNRYDPDTKIKYWERCIKAGDVNTALWEKLPNEADVNGRLLFQETQEQREEAKRMRIAEERQRKLDHYNSPAEQRRRYVNSFAITDQVARVKLNAESRLIGKFGYNFAPVNRNDGYVKAHILRGQLAGGHFDPATGEIDYTRAGAKYRAEKAMKEGIQVISVVTPMPFERQPSIVDDIDSLGAKDIDAVTNQQIKDSFAAIDRDTVIAERNKVFIDLKAEEMRYIELKNVINLNILNARKTANKQEENVWMTARGIAVGNHKNLSDKIMADARGNQKINEYGANMIDYVPVFKEGIDKLRASNNELQTLIDQTKIKADTVAQKYRAEVSQYISTVENEVPALKHLKASSSLEKVTHAIAKTYPGMDAKDRATFAELMHSALLHGRVVPPDVSLTSVSREFYKIAEQIKAVIGVEKFAEYDSFFNRMFNAAAVRMEKAKITGSAADTADRRTPKPVPAVAATPKQNPVARIWQKLTKKPEPKVVGPVLIPTSNLRKFGEQVAPAAPTPAPAKSSPTPEVKPAPVAAPAPAAAPVQQNNVTPAPKPNVQPVANEVKKVPSMDTLKQSVEAALKNEKDMADDLKEITFAVQPSPINPDSVNSDMKIEMKDGNQYIFHLYTDETGKSRLSSVTTIDPIGKRDRVQARRIGNYVAEGEFTPDIAKQIVKEFSPLKEVNKLLEEFDNEKPVAGKPQEAAPTAEAERLLNDF